MNIKSDSASSIALGLEAIEKGKLEFAKTCFESAGINERIIAKINSGISVDNIVYLIKNEIERSVSIFDLIRMYSRNDVSKKAKELAERAFKYLDRGSYGQFSYPSLRIWPKANQRSLTETTGSTLIGTTLHPELGELPNVIPTLQKINVTFNLVEGTATQQAIPKIVTNPAVADIKDNAVIGTLNDPAFGLCPGTVNVITSQLTLSRRFFLQASDLAKELLNQMLFNSEMNALMYRVFYGDPTFGQCTGVYNDANVEKISGDSFTDIIGNNVMKKVHENEAPSENCLWVINAATEEKLKQRAVSSGNKNIIDKGLLLDKPYVLSERIAAGHLFYGAFNSIVLTLFNLEFLVDPYESNFNEVKIKHWQPYSVDVRNSGWIKCVENFN